MSRRPAGRCTYRKARLVGDGCQLVVRHCQRLYGYTYLSLLLLSVNQELRTNAVRFSSAHLYVNNADLFNYISHAQLIYIASQKYS